MIIAKLVKKFSFPFTAPEVSLTCLRQVPRSFDFLLIANCMIWKVVWWPLQQRGVILTDLNRKGCLRSMH
jgi:hypothetical protein